MYHGFEWYGRVLEVREVSERLLECYLPAYYLYRIAMLGFMVLVDVAPLAGSGSEVVALLLVAHSAVVVDTVAVDVAPLTSIKTTLDLIRAMAMVGMVDMEALLQIYPLANR